jgi:hypothetical protein
MRTEVIVVDNRVFLLGLCELYRDAMKPHERGELLACARRVAGALGVPPADVPIEGYYAEDDELTAYFRLMRALQEVLASRTPIVKDLPEFGRLREVTSAPLFGRPVGEDYLLPLGRDPLSQALSDTQPEWSVERLTEAAYDAAERYPRDISLVGLAARIRDPVVLTALRESVVLFAELLLAGPPRQPEYVWQVDDDLAARASRFIDAFNALFDERLPPPKPKHVAVFVAAWKRSEILGRCVRLGGDTAENHYHWAICGAEELTVHEFWHGDVWTTERYRRALGPHGRPPDL